MKHHVLFLLLFAGCLLTNAAVRVTNMKVSGLSAPLGIDETPTFSWQTESDERGFVQQSYTITVTDASGRKVWQSGVVASDAQCNIRYEGMPLRSRSYEPVRVVETWKAVSVTPVTLDGKQAYVIDFGKNFAGTFRFSLRGKRGQTITLRTGHLLDAEGKVKQETFNAWPYDIYDTYTFKEEGSVEQWGPTFMYHGTRYLQILGLTEPPTPEQFTAFRMRAAVEQTGEFVTSNTLLNDIHTICRDGIQSQIYNAFTDCPHREKLGWLDVPNELYYSIGYNYDMAAFWSKTVQDCFDAQYATGKVPSTVPHFHGDWDDDPNWGGSAIFVPYRNWRMYGDKRLMTKHYDGMKRLIDYYTGMTRDHLMPGSSYSALSDWGQGSSGLTHQIPAEFTITTSYYYLLNAMSEMAAELGHTDDAATFAETAKEVKKAFNKRFFHAETGVYDFGNQGDYGMPLYYGLVDAENEERVTAKLAESVRNADYKIKTGEIALKPVLMSLAKYGYNDIVYRMANQTDYPSYGYWVKQGCTTTPELWNMEYSQNHCMMNHIEEWFYSQLGGIQMADGAEGIGFHRFVIRPWMPADLAHMRARTLARRASTAKYAPNTRAQRMASTSISLCQPTPRQRLCCQPPEDN